MTEIMERIVKEEREEARIDSGRSPCAKDTDENQGHVPSNYP